MTPWGHLAAVAAAALFLGGCGAPSPPATFYTLTAAPALMDAPRPVAEGPAVGITLQAFPEALDRPQIVTRDGANRLKLAEFHRWGGTLKGDLLQVLSENLAARLGAARIATAPWPAYFAPDLRIALEVLRFDGRLGETACLKARWTLTDASGRDVLRQGEASLESSAEGQDYEALVAAQSLALTELSGLIAAQILELPPPR